MQSWLPLLLGSFERQLAYEMSALDVGGKLRPSPTQTHVPSKLRSFPPNQTRSKPAVVSACKSSCVSSALVTAASEPPRAEQKADAADHDADHDQPEEHENVLKIVRVPDALEDEFGPIGDASKGAVRSGVR